MLVLGGGGYTISNVARCWAYETGRIVGKLSCGKQRRAATPVGSCWCLACEFMKPNMTACLDDGMEPWLDVGCVCAIVWLGR